MRGWSEDVLVDHIFVRNAKARNAKRILDDEISLTNIFGKEVTGFRSDHFGYLTTVIFELPEDSVWYNHI